MEDWILYIGNCRKNMRIVLPDITLPGKENFVSLILFLIMSDKDIQNLIALAQSKIDRGVTKEEAKADLIAAGIFDNKGNYTEPYRILETVVNPS